MIFVSVGTHEQGFERLVKEIDDIKGNGLIMDDVFIQRGNAKFTPKHSKHAISLGYDEMIRRIKESRIFITHGGPGSIFLSLRLGKIPIVVPRMKDFCEHVDNHQISFTKKLESTGKILAVYRIDDLKEKICNYDEYAKNHPVIFPNSRDLSLVNKLDEFCQKLASDI